MKKKKTVVLGVTGGVAVYKSLDIVSKLKKKNIDVHVIMTKSSMEFVKELSFRSLSLNPVTTEMFERPNTFEVEHISLAKKADVFLIAPATANIIGKIANGIADDMLSTTVMATKAPVVIAPAMNTNMYENVIVQNNIKLLKNHGYHFVEPTSGRLACGDIGKGKLESTDTIVEYVEMLLEDKRDLEGKNILITAGPTKEDIDPVRYISNKSSGKMGYALAKRARDRGANVTLISGEVYLNPIGFIKIINIYSAEDMRKAVLNNLDKNDIIIKAAAVSDYRMKEKSPIKIKKSDENMTLKLEKNADILFEVGKIKREKIVVGFAAETNNVIENAKIKLKKKNLDIIVANDVSSEDIGFNSNDNKVSIITSNNVYEYDILSKEDVADNILDKILEIKR